MYFFVFYYYRSLIFYCRIQLWRAIFIIKVDKVGQSQAYQLKLVESFTYLGVKILVTMFSAFWIPGNQLLSVEKNWQQVFPFPVKMELMKHCMVPLRCFLLLLMGTPTCGFLNRIYENLALHTQQPIYACIPSMVASAEVQFMAVFNTWYKYV